MSNAVIYARYSSHEQREKSIEDQIRECEAAAERAGDTVVAVYADRAKSGTSAAKRAEFMRMVNDSKFADWERVWTYKTDRFARNRYDSAIYKRVLAKNGIDVSYAAEAIPDGPIGIIVEALLEGLAEYYSANLSENVIRGLTGNALLCHPNGVRRYGYAAVGARIEDGKFVPSDRYEVVPCEAEGVRMAFKMRGNLAPYRDIANAMNDSGFRNTVGRTFTDRVAARILNDEFYLGVYWYGGVRKPGGVPAIVTKKEWDAAHRPLAVARPRRHVHDIRGMVFHGWEAVEHVGTDDRHRWIWRIRHECGYERDYYAFLLNQGKRPLCPVCAGNTVLRV